MPTPPRRSLRTSLCATHARHRLLAGLLGMCLALSVLTTTGGPSAAGNPEEVSNSSTPTSVAALHGPPEPVVRGNRLLDARTGDPLRLAGVNRSGTEYACVQGWGFSDGPVDSDALARIAAWGTNVVRVPLNSTCWLGLHGVAPQWSGEAYRDAVAALVGRLHDQGQAVILDLHWSAPGQRLATGQTIAPDADHAPDFWRSVATRFADDPAVMFELFNEPREIGWDCWRDGCRTTEGWQAAGHQELLDAVRSAGADQPVILDGLHWGGDLSRWATHAPLDPTGQLVAGWHVYDFSQCSTDACWDDTAGELARTVPVVLTEVGQAGCGGAFLERILSWADQHQVGYVAWAWNTASCADGPSLISDYDGTPTAYGAAFRSHLAPDQPAPDPGPDPVEDDAAPQLRMHFDRVAAGAQGWTTHWGRVLVDRVTAAPTRGRGALSLRTRSGYPAVSTTHVAGLAPGDRVTLEVRATGRTAHPAVRPVVATSDGAVTVLDAQTLRRDRWQTVAFTVPTDLPAVGRVGLQVEVGNGHRTSLRVDNVTW